MALVSNIGLGSGLDISNLVKQLVDSERAGPSAALNRREAKTKSQISALGQVTSALAQLQTAVKKLQTGTAFDGRSVTSSDTDRMSVSISSGGKPALATYQIEIESLASAQKLQSPPAAVAEATTAVGAGTLQITAGSTAFDVEVAADDTIYDLAAAINTAAAGKVQAAVIRGDAGFSLSLTAGKTGADGTLAIAQTAGGTTLSAFTFDPDTYDPDTYDPDLPGATMGQTEPASDAVFYIDGVKRTTSSNTVADAIDGLELVLKKAEAASSFTLKVGEDTSGALQAVDGFVKAYNTTLDVLAKVSAFDLEAKTAEALNGDAFVRSARAQLRTFIGDALGAAAESGVKPGFDTQVDGKLSVKTVDFLSSLQSDPDALKALFSGEDATLTSALSGFLDGVLGSEGVLARRTGGLNDSLKRVATDRTALDRRMVSIEERYRKQFIALDGLLGKLNSTSQYLGQQLANLPGPRS